MRKAFVCAHTRSSDACGRPGCLTDQSSQQILSFRKFKVRAKLGHKLGSKSGGGVQTPVWWPFRAERSLHLKNSKGKVPCSQLSASQVGNCRTARDTQVRPGHVSHPWGHPCWTHVGSALTGTRFFQGSSWGRGALWDPLRIKGSIKEQANEARHVLDPVLTGSCASNRLASWPSSTRDRATQRSVIPGEAREVSRSGGSSSPRAWAVSDFCSFKRCFIGAWVGFREERKPESLKVCFIPVVLCGRSHALWFHGCSSSGTSASGTVLISGGTAVVLGRGGTNTSVWCQKALRHCWETWKGSPARSAFPCLCPPCCGTAVWPTEVLCENVVWKQCLAPKVWERIKTPAGNPLRWTPWCWGSLNWAEIYTKLTLCGSLIYFADYFRMSGVFHKV